MQLSIVQKHVQAPEFATYMTPFAFAPAVGDAPFYTLLRIWIAMRCIPLAIAVFFFWQNLPKWHNLLSAWHFLYDVSILPACCCAYNWHAFPFCLLFCFFEFYKPEVLYSSGGGKNGNNILLWFYWVWSFTILLLFLVAILNFTNLRCCTVVEEGRGKLEVPAQLVQDVAHYVGLNKDGQRWTQMNTDKQR